MKRKGNSKVSSSESHEIMAEKMTAKIPEKSQKTEHPIVPQVSCLPPTINEKQRPSSPLKQSQDSHIEARPSSLTNGPVEFGVIRATDKLDGLQSTLSSTGEASQNTSPKKKPPVISKKPKISLTFKTINYTSSIDEDASELLNAQTEENVSTAPTEFQEPTPISQEEDKKPDNDKSVSSVLLGEMREISLTNVEPQEISQPLEEEEEDDYEDATSSTGSVGCKDDEIGESDLANLTQ